LVRGSLHLDEAGTDLAKARERGQHGSETTARARTGEEGHSSGSAGRRQAPGQQALDQWGMEQGAGRSDRAARWEPDLPRGVPSGRSLRLASHSRASRPQAATMERSPEADPLATSHEAEASARGPQAGASVAEPLEAAHLAPNQPGRSLENGLQAILAASLAAVTDRRSSVHFRQGRQLRARRLSLSATLNLGSLRGCALSPLSIRNGMKAQDRPVPGLSAAVGRGSSSLVRLRHVAKAGAVGLGVQVLERGLVVRVLAGQVLAAKAEVAVSLLGHSEAIVGWRDHSQPAAASRARGAQDRAADRESQPARDGSRSRVEAPEDSSLVPGQVPGRMDHLTADSRASRVASDGARRALILCWCSNSGGLSAIGKAQNRSSFDWIWPKNSQTSFTTTADL
jgi:hypothetical protein